MVTSITLADLTGCEDGTVLVAKDAVDGSSRRISHVANGLRCGCVCYGCGRDLVAKNGGYQYRHHFAHQPDEVTANCATAGETVLHILGREIIARHVGVTMPETWLTDLDGNLLVVTPRRSIELTDIHLETADGELVPDNIATTPEDRRLSSRSRTLTVAHRRNWKSWRTWTWMSWKSRLEATGNTRSTALTRSSWT